MEVGNSEKRCREVDEEGRLTLVKVVCGERWIPGNSSVSTQPRSQWQTLDRRRLRSE